LSDKYLFDDASLKATIIAGETCSLYSTSASANADCDDGDQ